MQEEMKFIHDCLACSQFKASDIKKGCKLNKSTIYSYLNDPNKIYYAKPEVIQQFYEYFGSFNFDHNRVQDIRRVITYVQI